MHRLPAAFLAALIALSSVLGVAQPAQAWASGTIVSMTPSAAATAGQTISVTYSVNVQSGNTFNYVRWNWDGGSSWACTPVSVASGQGVRQVTFNVTAPPPPTGSNGLGNRQLRVGADNDCSGTPSAIATSANVNVTAPTAAPNLDISPACGMDIIMVLDESGSIVGQGGGGASNILTTVRNAANSFISGLQGTGSYVRVVEFASRAQDASIGSNTGWQEVTGGYTTSFNTYINNNSSWGADAYRAGSSNTIGQYTNWHAALYRVSQIANREPGRVPLVIFFTDGNPTAAGIDTLIFENASFETAALNAGVSQANAVKAQGRHMFVIGFPNPNLETSNIIAISGPNQYGTGVGQTTNIGEADFVAAGTADLGAIFSAIIDQLCGVKVEVTKWVDNNNDGVEEAVAAGWPFQGTVSGPASYTWVQPVAGAGPVSGSTSQVGTTSAAGKVVFQWKYNNIAETSNIVVTEQPNATQNDEYWLKSLACDVRPAASTFTPNVAGKSFTLNGLPNKSNSECKVVNVRKPKLLAMCSDESLSNPNHPDSNTPYIEGTTRNTDASAQANGWSMEISLPSSLAGKLKFTGAYASVDGANNPLPATCTVSDQLATCTLNSGVLPAGVSWKVKAYTQQLVTGALALTGTTVKAINSAGEQFQTSSSILESACFGMTPVTLSYFSAVAEGDGVRFDWSTTTESNNAGFNLYAENESGRVRLNPEMIPSAVVNSATRQDYSLRVAGVGATVFYLEDVDLFDNAVLHGPFVLGEAAGEQLAPEPIDWAAVNAEHAAKAQARSGADTAAVNAFLAARGATPDSGAQGDVQEWPGFVEADPDSITIRNPAYLPLVSTTLNAELAEGEPTAAAAQATDPKIQLQVKQTGLYRVSYEQLAAAGFALAGIPASDLALTNQGQAVPMRLVSARRFGPGAYIEFYGQALDTFYSDTNVYLLEVNRTQALRAGVNSSGVPSGEPVAYYLETVTVDANKSYSFLSPNGDPWYNDWFFAVQPTTKSYPLEIDQYVAGAAPVTLSVDVWGMSQFGNINPDHHVRIGLNNAAPTAEGWFDAGAGHTIVGSVAEGVLVNGANTLQVSVPNDTGAPRDMVALDKYSLSYPRAFVAREGSLRFTAAGTVLQVSGLPTSEVFVYRVGANSLVRMSKVAVADLGGGNYAARFRGTAEPTEYLVVAGSALKMPLIQAQRPAADITSGAADYVMISHPDFIAGLGPLVQFHQGRGLNVKVVDVEEVYAQFGNGIFGPEGIQRYIAHAVTQMGVRFVLLVGGDTYDYRHYLVNGGLSFIPSFYASTGPDSQFAPADPLYGDVDGDRMPDVAIGRLPVRSDGELANLIQKTLVYAAKGYGKSAVFAADSGFGQASESLRLSGAADWTSRTAYLDQTSAAAANSTIVGAINSGVALASYVGHSGPVSWGFKGLFTAGHAAALTNTTQPTAVTQWGCWNNYYVDPSYNTLAHKFLVSGQQGAALVLGSTGVSYASSEQALGDLLMPRLTQPGMTVGEALLQAKRSLGVGNERLNDVILGWTLLGDPAAQIVP